MSSQEKSCILSITMDKVLKKHLKKDDRKLDKIERRALKDALLFELLMRFIATYLILPAFRQVLKLSYRLAGFNFIRSDNLMDIVKDPLSLLYLFILWFVFGLSLLFECVTLIRISSPHRVAPQRLHIQIRHALTFTWRSLKKRPFSFLFVTLLLAPFMSLAFASPMLPEIKIPSFIMDSILENTWQVALMIAFFVLVFILFLVLAFSLHKMVLDDKSLPQAVKHSARLFKQWGDRLFTLLMRKTLIFILALLLLVVLALLLFFLLILLVSEKQNLLIAVLSFGSFSANVLAWALGAFLSAYFWSIISHLYRRFLPVDSDAAPLSIPKRPPKQVALKVVLSFLLALSVFSIEALRINYLLTSEQNDAMIKPSYADEKVRITAHRGITQNAPENSLASIQAAIDAKVDDVEIDVQISRDGEVFLFHDAKLGRLTTDSRPFEACSSTEIKSLHLKFKKKETNEKIPTLNEALRLGQGKIRYNIEIKGSQAREKELVAASLKIVQSLGMEKEVFFASLRLSSLQEVKKIAPAFKTCYILPFVQGDFFELTEIDDYSIEASNVNEDLVNNLREKKKELLVWTVNDEESMRKVLDSGAKNLITDDVQLARKNILMKEGRGSLSLGVLDLILPLLDD